jgi:hypothetical protein
LLFFIQFRFTSYQYWLEFSWENFQTWIWWCLNNHWYHPSCLSFVLICFQIRGGC